MWDFFCFFFFFQAEDGIRDLYVTGVQTCALPISVLGPANRRGELREVDIRFLDHRTLAGGTADGFGRELGDLGEPRQQRELAEQALRDFEREQLGDARADLIEAL